MLFSAQAFAAQVSASNVDLAFAGALYSFFRAFGQALGVAISGVIFQNTLKRKIKVTAYSMYAGEWSRDASALVEIIKGWSRDGEEGLMREAVVTAYVESLQMVWLVMCILAFVMFAANLIWTDELSLNRELETEQGFIHDLKNDEDDSAA
jgi:hypothetical protein